MGVASTRVFYEDGQVAWTSFDEGRDEVGAVLWPERRDAQQARPDEIRDRFRRSETYGAGQKAVHTDMGTILCDRARCVPVVVEVVTGGVASWWTGLATRNRTILATNREANEPRVKERGLFRPHPDYQPGQIRVTGVDWDKVDWSDVDCEIGSPTP